MGATASAGQRAAGLDKRLEKMVVLTPPAVGGTWAEDAKALVQAADSQPMTSKLHLKPGVAWTPDRRPCGSLHAYAGFFLQNAMATTR